MQISPDSAFVNGFLDGTELALLTREPSGALLETRVPAEWVAYFQRGSVPQPLLDGMIRAARSYRTEDEWLRFAFATPDARRTLCFRESQRDWATGNVVQNPLLAAGVKHFEADVDPLRRFFTDTGAKVQRPRRAYIDLETDSRLPFREKLKMRVLCWAMTDDRLRTSCDVLDEWSDEAERYLLERFWEELGAYDQVCAWNGGEPFEDGDGFDFPVLIARSERVGVRNVDARRWLFTDQMVAFRRMNMHAAESGEEKRSMKLQNVAMATIDEGKQDFDAGKTYEAWAAGGARRRELVAYCVQDTELLPKIEKKTGYLDLFSTICEVCRLFPTTQSLNPTQQMDGFLLRLARERGQHLPSRAYHGGDAPQEQFKGAFVMKPKTLDPTYRAREGMANGIARDVHVADFASLYPSIMVSWNMSPDTKVSAPVNGPIPPGTARCPKTGTSFSTTTVGLLALAIMELLRLRKHYSDLQASLPPGTPEWYDAMRRSMAYKVAANSFYGVLGNMYSRYFDRAIAEGVTQNGVWLIEQTIAAAEERGWKVVYGDTDSIFCTGCTKEQFAEFVAWCNKDLYPRIVAAQGCATNTIKLAYEKAFDRLVFTAGKRYIGSYSHYKGKPATAASKPEVKGLEYKRGDASLMAADLQRTVVDMILSGREDLEPYHRLLSETRQRILEDDIPLEEIVVSKSLQKSLGKWDKGAGAWKETGESYKQKLKNDGSPAALPPHVTVARILAARGQDVREGTRVDYVVVDADHPEPARRVIPAEDFAGEFDRHHVWESTVFPATWRLLEAAFPAAEAHWKAWSRSRPVKQRAGRPALAGQASLFGLDVTETRVSVVRANPEPPLPRA
jgi:DNA polymerase elongation subunit (family B)